MTEQVQKPKFWGQFMSGFHRRTPFNRRLPGFGGPQLLLAQPVLLLCQEKDEEAKECEAF